MDRQVVTGILIGAAGGGLFWLLGLPAPWLTGPLLAVGGAAVAGVPLRAPEWARFLLFVLLGVSIGSAVNPESLHRMAQWPASLAINAVGIVATIYVGMVYLRRMLGCDRITALLASIPGTQSLVMAIALNANADVRQVTVIQSVRLFALVFLFPIAASLFAGGRVDAAVPAAAVFGPDTIWLLAVAAAGAAAAVRLKMPAGALTGAMLLSAALHGTGLNEALMPPWLVSFALALLGVIVGARFAGTRLRALLRTALISVGMVGLALAVSAAFAAAADAVLGLGFGALLLAYAPGGIEAMTLIASSLGLDPALVGTHHLVRMIAMALILPVVARRMPR